MNNNIICNNCLKTGHLFHNCKHPIVSYGIIGYRKSSKGIQYLMICRKDSFGYIEMIRGKYVPYNIQSIQKIVDTMSLNEKQKIYTYNFNTLWNELWGDRKENSYNSEKTMSLKKFEIIKNGITINEDECITLNQIISNSETAYQDAEWEFPKGRREFSENDLECAIREFEEETGFPRNNIKIIENILPFEEIFIGSNHKCYKHKYFLAKLEDDKDDALMQRFQESEVSKIEWKTIDECIASIRPYNLEKKQVITNVDTLLREYNILATL